MDQKALFKLTYGLFVLTVKEGEKENGCIINTAIQVTAVPNRISIAVNKANATHDMVLSAGRFHVSVISQDAKFSLFQHFGFQSGRDVDKFADFAACERAEDGIPYITEGCNAWFAAKVEQAIDLGSHTLFIAAVEDMQVLSDVPSASYEYYQTQIKPKPQVPAAAGKTVWRCRVCGYEYEGEELPADFICPLCKHPASDFEKVTVGQA